jgi:hypothetical protein
VNARQLVLAWLIALALATTVSVGLVLLADRTSRARESDIIVLGSSLMAYAVPASGGGAGSLLGDGRTHIRIATAGLAEPALLARIEQAIARQPAIIFVEANPLLADFANQTNQRPCDGWSYPARTYVAAQQKRVIDAFRRLRGRPPTGAYEGDPDDIAAAHAINRDEVRIRYPITIRALCDEARLKALVTQARKQGTRIVLVLPPRSPDADRLLGTALTEQLRNRTLQLAARLGVEVFAPDGPWTNDEFTDLAHVNLRGRAHFLKALRTWWATAE